MKLDENECVDLWIAVIRKDPDERYTFDKRKEHLETLMEYFTDNEIDKDSAQMMKRKAVEALVTKEGMKGKGKHNGWKENAEADFNDAIQLTYVLPNVSKKLKPLRNAQGHDPRIVKWAKEKFGEQIGEDIVIAAHQPMHALWMMFMNDHYNRDTGGIL